MPGWYWSCRSYISRGAGAGAGNGCGIKIGRPARACPIGTGLAVARGELSSQTDWAGRTIAYSYDADGNLVSTSYPNGVSVANTYDLGDAMTSLSATSGGGSLAGANYSLDSAEQLTNETDSGALAASGQPSTSYSYDAADRLGSVTQTTTYPNGVNVSDSFDLAGAMTALTATASDGTLAAGISYGLDSAEQVSAETDAGALSGSVSYSYDSADRLGTVAKGTSAPASAAYDPAGNPTTLATGATQAFDRAGELTSATEPSGAKVAYTYNPSGDRTGATTTAPSGTTTTSAYGYSCASRRLRTPVPVQSGHRDGSKRTGAGAGGASGRCSVVGGPVRPPTRLRETLRATGPVGACAWRHPS
ncbi:MAG TPA: hypothetical protein VFN61_14430 [Acidimicrobiales bacterium]|nr:hypothetical protein [Acidimicrobiales bacterium]